MAVLNKDINIPYSPDSIVYDRIDTFDPFFEPDLQPDSSGFFNKNIFIPDRCYCAFVFLAGGSGGGGMGAYGGGFNYGGGGGGAGQLVYAAYNVMPGDQLACKIGRGGISPTIENKATDGGNGIHSEMRISSIVYNYNSTVLTAAQGNGGYGYAAGKNKYKGGSGPSASNESKVLSDSKIPGIVDIRRNGLDGAADMISAGGYVTYQLFDNKTNPVIGAGGSPGGQNSMDDTDSIRYPDPTSPAQHGSINIGYIYDLNMQNSALYFNPGQYSLKVPEGVSSIKFYMMGGGGYGGVSLTASSNVSIATGGGGSSGEYITDNLSVSPGDIITLNVGEMEYQSSFQYGSTTKITKTGINGTDGNFNYYNDHNYVIHGGASVNGGPGAGQDGYISSIQWTNDKFKKYANGGTINNNLYKGSGMNSYFPDDPNYNLEALKIQHSGSVSLYYNQPAQNNGLYTRVGFINNNTIPDNVLGLATITVFAIPKINELLILQKSSTFKFDISFAKVEGQLKLLNIGALVKFLHDNSMLQDINVESIIDNKHNIVFHVRNLLDKYKITIKHSISYSN